MRRVARRTPNRSEKAIPYTVSAPVGGWNARDSLDQMAEDDAVFSDNFFPGFGKVSLRSGSSSYATGLGADVFTIAEFNAGALRKLIAGANGKLWNISSAGAGVSLKTGFTGNKWQWGQFDDASGGARMGLVNGVDAPQIFNGTAVTAMTVSCTGLTTTTLLGINIYKNRSYFWDGVSQDFYYSATNALGGTLTKFPLGRVSGFGGNLLAMGTMTVDGGDGVNDLACFFMTSGDVVIYNGSNPGDTSDWYLIGIFRIGAPLSVRGIMKAGKDLVVMTKDGYVALSKVLGSARSQPKDAISDKIRGAVSEAAQQYSANYGWQAIHYPRGTMALFNVPLSTGEFNQHVVNTTTGAWCRFKGLNARSMGLYNDRLYIGLSGTVFLADTGYADGSTAISGDCQTAWTYFKRRNQQKRLTMAKILGNATGIIPYTIAIGADFKDPTNTIVGTTGLSGSGSGLWDSSDWDTTSWPSENLVFDAWGSAGAIGLNFSTRLRVASSANGMNWFSSAYAFEPGGLI